MPAAARVSDQHTCPMTNPNGSPHTGGPILGPGAPSVLIKGLAAAVVATPCTCAGPPDSIKQGSQTVKFEGKAAARMGDPTQHGGSITGGESSVIIGG